MKQFSEFSSIVEEVDCNNFTLYKGINKKDNTSVLIKHYKHHFRDKQLTRLEKEFPILPKENIDGMLSPSGLHVIGGQIVMVFEDDNLSLLSSVLSDGPLELAEFLGLAANLSTVLLDLHAQGHVHKDLRTSNILVNQAMGDIRIVGLFLSQFLNPEETTSFLDSDDEAFVYTSPEQTGRTGQVVDTRSDLYSLGVIFYEILTGKVPFLSQNPLVRIHSHIARQPDSIQTHNPDLPPIINEIIQKLLNKNADNRYQSAKGLHNDLKHCLGKLSNDGNLGTFVLGKSDRTMQFHMPRKLYGAKKNLVKLEEAFNRVCAGSVELVKVCGKAGVGKTSLIDELEKLVNKKGGQFAKGKSEKEQKDTPYRSLIRTVYILINKILSQPENEITLWKEKILNSIGRNGQIVIDFLPEMEIIIGKQPSVPELDAEAAQNRVDHVFQKVIQTFTFEGNPLVLFLDSFHWADAASIRIIQSYLSDLNSRHVL
ncbi:MAG: AAA family ATPase, partial [Proteobacteria bacterium]|nr:AAA family ATPase [Pseudomonadota bacterium]